jgi:hypothetical protein
MADKKRKEDLQRDLEALAQRQMEILAEMEVEQEIADENEEQDAIKTLADMDAIEDVKMPEIAADVNGSESGGDTEADSSEESDSNHYQVPAKYVVGQVPTSIRFMRKLNIVNRERKSLARARHEQQLTLQKRSS